MRRFWIVIASVLIVVTAAYGPSRPATASGHADAALAKKKCKYVTKVLHGKKTKVRVCHRVTPPSPPTPTATPNPRSLQEPYGVGVVSQGYIYVALTSPARIAKLAPDGSYVTAFGQDVLQGTSKTCGPAGIFISRADSIYVGETCQHAVFEFSTTGQLLKRYPADPNLTAGDSGPDFQYPLVDSAGNVFVTEVLKGTVERFSADGTQLSVVYGDVPSALGLALDPQGNLYVGRARDDIVVKYSPSGQVLAQSDPIDNGRNATTVRGLALDSHGNLYAAADGGGGCNPLDQVEELSPSLKFIRTIADGGSGPGQVCAPQGLAVDAQDNVYVADLFNNRVEKFSPSGKLLATFTGG